MTIELKEFLNKTLKLAENLSLDEEQEFYSVINEYLTNRSKIETLQHNLIDLIELLKDYNLSDYEIILAIKNNPSYIHTDKVELAIKFMLAAKVADKNLDGEDNRKNLIINKGKYFRINYNLIYARIKWLLKLQEEENSILRNNDITVRKVFKITNEEFKNTYEITKEELLQQFPFTVSSLQEIKAWDENLRLIEEIQNEKNRKY